MESPAGAGPNGHVRNRSVLVSIALSAFFVSDVPVFEEVAVFLIINIAADEEILVVRSVFFADERVGRLADTVAGFTCLLVDVGTHEEVVLRSLCIFGDCCCLLGSRFHQIALFVAIVAITTFSHARLRD